MNAKLCLEGKIEVDVFVGEDGALVVQIDTQFEPDETPFRVWLNDASLHNGPKE